MADAGAVLLKAPVASTWNADSAVWNFQRVMDPKTVSYSAFLLYPIKNAQKINAGKLPPAALGVEAPDAHTLLIHLEHPWVNLLLYTSSRVMWPGRRTRPGTSWRR